MRENNRLNRPQMVAMMKDMTKGEAVKWVYSLIPASKRTIKKTDAMGFVTDTGMAYEEYVGAMAYNDRFGDWEEYETEVLVDGQIKIDPRTGAKFYEKKLRCIREEKFPPYKKRADLITDAKLLQERLAKAEAELVETKGELKETKVELTETKTDTKAKIKKLKADKAELKVKAKPAK